jgi:hypothetical protein
VEDQNFNPAVQLNLDLNKVNMILGALAEFPYRVAAEVITDIQQQAVPQVQAAKAAADAENQQPVTPPAE